MEDVAGEAEVNLPRHIQGHLQVEDLRAAIERGVHPGDRALVGNARVDQEVGVVNRLQIQVRPVGRDARIFEIKLGNRGRIVSNCEDRRAIGEPRVAVRAWVDELERSTRKREEKAHVDAYARGCDKVIAVTVAGAGCRSRETLTNEGRRNER